MNTPPVYWPHAPPHKLEGKGAYFVTASTYEKRHHFLGPERLEVLRRGLLRVANDFCWRLEAWAVFSNHYHFVARSPDGANGALSLSPMLSGLHERTAKWVNKLDRTTGRKVWHNFRDTHLTFEKSYFARLNYTHQNAVRHGLVLVGSHYPWCSAKWFECTATPAQVQTIYAFKTDAVKVTDDFESNPDW